MATQPSEEQGKSNHAEPAADVCVSIGSASSESGGAPEISKEEVDGQYYRPLLQAAFKGDWESAKRFFERDSASKMAKITSRSETVLHIAALSAQDQFLENLVELLSPCPEELEMVDCDGRTALHNAVLCGRLRMVKLLVRSNPKLTQLADNEGRVPLGISAVEASMHNEIAWFLAKNTTDDGPSQPFSSSSVNKTIMDLTYNGHHDITLYLVGRYPHLINIKSGGFSILHKLARMESHFPSGTRLGVLEKLIYKCISVDLNYKPTDKNSDPALQRPARSLWNAAKIVVPINKRIHEVKRRHMAAVELAKQVCIAISHRKTTEITDFIQENNLLDEAMVRGISEIVKLCIQFFPELIWIKPYGVRLTTRAVTYRQERTLRLFLKVSSTNQLSLVPGPTEEESSEMLSVVAEYAAIEYYPNFDATTNVAGAAFQMQRELQWYKAVESWIVPNVRTGYYEHKTYWNRFVENHTELLKNGEKWAKDTANSCMLVSTLIATVLFAAAFTVPGGNNDKTGVPLLLGKDSLLIFAISDALGLFSSVTAILLFLAILTSRYEAQDFLEALPKKIIMGLCFLFLSLAFMLVAFTATLTIVLDTRLEWVLIPITLLASLPVALFVVLQIPLLYQMVKSTYGPSIFRAESN
ncbi:uncharacterized protein LOC115685184 isoform X2 [Syzygium oleosum]|uniref:uncharacterized protein LOC115685184 isoform X2 n=1 Tax=Syzygium oleosum TaxID=219896 RepID=UPI0024BA08F6|nr:uncharacterized protein LOC115685184 isoform X2 [Syzygium oleosum]